MRPVSRLRAAVRRSRSEASRKARGWKPHPLRAFPRATRSALRARGRRSLRRMPSGPGGRRVSCVCLCAPAGAPDSGRDEAARGPPFPPAAPKRRGEKSLLRGECLMRGPGESLARERNPPRGLIDVMPGRIGSRGSRAFALGRSGERPIRKGASWSAPEPFRARRDPAARRSAPPRVRPRCAKGPGGDAFPSPSAGPFAEGAGVTSSTHQVACASFGAGPSDLPRIEWSTITETTRSATDAPSESQRLPCVKPATR